MLRRTWFSAPLAALWAAPPKLSIVRPTLHYQREEGPPISSTYEYVPGELLYLTFRLAGYQVTKDKVDLRYQVVMTDPDGLLVLPPITGAVAAEVSDNDKDWLPKAQETIALPPQLPPGQFRLKIRIADELAKSSAEHELTFRVRGQTLEAADTLTLRNLRLFRDEEGKQPAIDSVYRPGDTVWGRFQIVGFQLGPKNQFDVEYGIQVHRPSGKLLYAEPKAAAEQDAPFYPKRLLQGILSLNLSKDLTPGVYSLTITARDNLSQKTAELKSTYRVDAG